ncbi:MAG: hypothetical protein U9Q72_03700 [Patescibacteria group bacterium]|nr:hypothetical protein [Patescibacteria group bacterium]
MSEKYLKNLNSEEDDMGEEIRKVEILEEVEIPKDWNEQINMAAKRWLADKDSLNICPVKNYLGIRGLELKKYCKDFCYRLFPEVYGDCPCALVSLEDVKNRVKKVIKEWEKEEMWTFRQKLFHSGEF